MGILVGLDPGFTSGLCLIDSVVSAEEFNVISCAELPWSNRFYFKKLFSIHYDNIEQIVIEKYNLYSRDALSQSGSIMPSARVIGICEAFAFEYGLIDKITYQGASEIKQHGSYTIRVLDQHKPQFTGFKREHTRDAYRHIRVFLRDQAKVKR